jgi:hypothetical protein
MATKPKKKKKKLSALAKLKMQLEWYNNFVDFIQDVDDNLYDDACKYADELEKK